MKIKKIKIVLLMFLLLPVGVFADSKSISISCPSDTVGAGNDVTCVISGSSDTDISSIDGTIVLGNGLIFKSFALESNWEGDVNDKRMTIHTSNPVNGNFKLGSIIVTVNNDISLSSTSIKLNNFVYYDATIDDSSGKYSVEEAHSDISILPVILKGLKSLTATNGGVLSPTLSDDNFVYLFSLSSSDIETFGISAVANNINDTVSAINVDTNEVVDLSNITFKTVEGKSSMSIKITVGSIEYTINATRPTKEDVGNAELSSLKIGGKNITLTSGVTEYAVTLDDVSSYSVVATLTDPDNYKFSDDTGLRLSPKTLSGELEIPIEIVAKDNTTGLSGVTYIITIKKVSSETTKPNSNGDSNASTNPETSGKTAIVMGIVLIASFIASVYLYGKNMNQYD